MDKKFDDEILSMEELDNVAGGTIHEMIADSEFLNKIGLKTTTLRNTKDIYRNFDQISAELRNTWLKAGVFCKTISNSNDEANVYTDLKGNVITRKQAMNIAMNFTGVHLNDLK